MLAVCTPNSSFTCTLLMSTLGAGPLDSSPHQECLGPGVGTWGPGVPSLEDMAEVEVLSPPGERFCTAVGPLGYLNLLAGRAPGFVSPMLGAGEMGVVEGGIWECAWGLGKLKPGWLGSLSVKPFPKPWVVGVEGVEEDVVVEEDTEEDEEEEVVVAAGGGVAFRFRGEFGWFGSCFTARLTKLAAPY